jgi:hypothetical protein
VQRPRPSDVPAAQSAVAPNDLQLYNDYVVPERTYSSERVVVHYVVRGIDAPPLNDADADDVPDYVERVGVAADRALAYYERRGFRAPIPDRRGPDARPDLYVSRFSPGTLGVAFPAATAAGGAFAVVSNKLDPSGERSFASVYATVAHELFHLVQFSYFRPGAVPAIPAWILEGTAAALESRVDPELDDLVSAIQVRRWFSATQDSLTTRATAPSSSGATSTSSSRVSFPSSYGGSQRAWLQGRESTSSPRRIRRSRAGASRVRCIASPSRRPSTTPMRSARCSSCDTVLFGARSSSRSRSTTSTRSCSAAARTRSG